jgi:hypothetical protein
MYKLFIILSLFSTLLFSQDKNYNPDGYIGGFSFHVTPYLKYGEADYKVSGVTAGKYDYPLALSVKVELAVPLNTSSSLKVFYIREENQIEIRPKGSIIYKEPDTIIDGHNNAIGATLSLYFGGK